MKSSIVKSGMLFFCLLVAISGLFLLESCGGSGSDPAPSTKDLLTSGTWNIQSVTVDGADKTSSFSNLAVTFTAAGSYSSTNGVPVWPSTGTWTLSADGTTITRDTNLPVTVSSITSSSLVLSLDWASPTFNGGRINSIAGKHVFTFAK